MAMEINSNYKNYTNYYTNDKNAEKTSYLNELQEKYSNIDIKEGTMTKEQAATSQKGFEGVMISSRYLQRAQKDEKTAKEMDEMLSGVESAQKWLKSAFEKEGLELVSCGYYIDDNGNMGSYSVVKKKDSMFDGLAKQSEDMNERIKEKKEEKVKEQKETEEIKEEKEDEKKKQEAAEEKTVGSHVDLSI